MNLLDKVDLKQRVIEIADAYPETLDSGGFWIDPPSRKMYYRYFPSAVPVQQATATADRFRQELFSDEFVSMVWECVDFIRYCNPVKTKSAMVSSYTWKHIVEDRRNQYIRNGAFIVAALICDVTLIHQGNLCPLIGLSRKSIASVPLRSFGEAPGLMQL